MGWGQGKQGKLLKAGYVIASFYLHIDAENGYEESTEVGRHIDTFNWRVILMPKFLMIAISMHIYALGTSVVYSGVPGLGKETGVYDHRYKQVYGMWCMVMCTVRSKLIIQHKVSAMSTKIPFVDFLTITDNYLKRGKWHIVYFASLIVCDPLWQQTLKLFFMIIYILIM